MHKPRVYLPNAVPDEAYRLLAEACELDYRGSEDPAPEAELLAHVGEAEGLMCYSRVKVGPALLAAAPRLRAVSNIAVGCDKLDLPALTRRGIVATNTPGVLTETTADLAFALILAAARRVAEADRYVKSRRWDGWRPSLMVGKDVYGATLGIVGLGRIGQAVARRGRGFAMRLLYHGRRRNLQAEAELDAEYRPLDALLGEADFVVLVTPLTAETTHLIGRRELALMKPDAYLINIARGAVVDEPALIDALREGRIAGAGLDVYAREPLPLDHPLLEMENVVTLPHIGSATKATRRAMALLAARNLLAALRGERPPHVVNTEVWPTAEEPTGRP